MIRILIPILLFLCTVGNAALSSNVLKERFLHSRKGDFVVTEQEGHATLLVVLSLQGHTLVLEEVVVPLAQINLKTICWQKWLSLKAPGHTAWTVYEIDLDKVEFRGAFSISRQEWVQLHPSEQLLTQLLALPMEPLPADRRKKIGTCTKAEMDHRALWNPPWVVHGKRVKPAAFDVFQTHWPSDHSPLSSAELDLYFSASDARFPFPLWIEIHTSHATVKWRAIDSGTDLLSTTPATLPKRLQNQRRNG